jgi:membrane-bound ClpP family serine protease
VSLLAIALGLFILALIIFVIDLMIPTGGILVAVTAMLALGAIVMSFMHSTTTGIWMMIATFAAIPLMFWLFIEVWPRTPIGKRLIVTPEPAKEFVWGDAGQSDTNSLIGSVGTVLNELLPSGLVLIGSQKFEAFSESGPIEVGKIVKVVRLDVGRLIVMETRDKPADVPRSVGSGLDRPANELNIESLEG